MKATKRPGFLLETLPRFFQCACYLYSREIPRSALSSSSMAALYEGYTLCGLVPDPNLSSSGIQGVEEERDSDHVVVTDSTRSVTLYKVTFKLCFQEALPTNLGQLISATRVSILRFSSQQCPNQSAKPNMRLSSYIVMCF